jgi:hypothetical protein
MASAAIKTTCSSAAGNEGLAAELMADVVLATLSAVPESVKAAIALSSFSPRLRSQLPQRLRRLLCPLPRRAGSASMGPAVVSTSTSAKARPLVTAAACQVSADPQLVTVVRVRWFDHRCKVNSDEFDRVFWRSDERFSSDLGLAWLQAMRACGVLSHASATTTTRAEPRPQAKEYTLGLQPLTTVKLGVRHCSATARIQACLLTERVEAPTNTSVKGLASATAVVHQVTMVHRLLTVLLDARVLFGLARPRIFLLIAHSEGTNKYKFNGSGFGDCCASSGYCGATTAHCTAGCQSAFGTCTSIDISPDGTCGGTKKYKGKGSSFGDCCSSNRYCGKTSDHCNAGCQTGFRYLFYGHHVFKSTHTDRHLY